MNIYKDKKKHRAKRRARATIIQVAANYVLVYMLKTVVNAAVPHFKLRAAYIC